MRRLEPTKVSEATGTGIDQPNQLVVAGKSAGFAHNYGHISLLTHADAPKEIYPLVEEWLKQHE